MGIIHEEAWNHFGLKPSFAHQEYPRIKKSRKGFMCRKCDSHKPKGTYYIGGRWGICFICAEEWFKKSKDTYYLLIRGLEAQEKKLKENKQQWQNELVINSL